MTLNGTLWFEDIHLIILLQVILFKLLSQEAFVKIQWELCIPILVILKESLGRAIISPAELKLN